MRQRVAGIFACLVTTTFVACGGGSSGSTISTDVAATVRSPPKIIIQPEDATAVIGGTAAFTVAVDSSDPVAYQWSRNGVEIKGATASSYMTTPAATDDGAVFKVIVGNDLGKVSSTSAKLTVLTTPGNLPPGTDVLTYKNDPARSGQNPAELLLTPGNVNQATFGLLHKITTDGYVDAQPLYVAQLSVADGLHNVVFVATEHDSVYAIDAENGAILWQQSLLPAGETPSGTDFPVGGNKSVTYSCNQTAPEVGITATPVIDRNAGPHGAIYLVAMSQDDSFDFHHRLHALDLTTGAELFGGPTEISASFPNAAGGMTTFEPAQYQERAALLLANGLIYTTWTSHCDAAPYGGWIIAFDHLTLGNTATLNVAPDSDGNILDGHTAFGSNGPSIWMGGAGPGADSEGNVYLLTANGRFETTLDANGFPSQGDFANSFLKLSLGSGSLAVSDYFTLFNVLAVSDADQELGSGGQMLLPDLLDSNKNVKHLVVGAGKDGNIYLVDRDAMGKYNATQNNIWQELDGALSHGIYSSPAYFNGQIYYGNVSGTLKAFKLTDAKLSAKPVSESADIFSYPGLSPVVSANGLKNGIVWAREYTKPSVLRAFDASDLSREIYNSNQASGGRDQFGLTARFGAPTVSGGKVFVGASDGLAILGLLPAPAAP